MNRRLGYLGRAGRIIVACVLTMAIAATTFTPAFAAEAVPAQQPVGLTVSPPTFEFSANPGETVSNSIRVENITDQPLDVSVDVRNFSALGEEGQVNLTSEDNPYAMAAWVKVAPTKDTIAAKDSKTFEYTITVPSNAQPGGRFGSIVFKTTPQAVSEGSGVAVGQEVGALIFMKIAGDVHENASIVGFKTTQKLYEYGPVSFETRVKNDGNVQFKPQGTITIANMFGKVVQTIPVDSRNVLPGAVRKMDAEWKNKWLFGPHSATVSLVYGSKGQIITATTTFWAFPYKIALVVLAGICLLAFFVRRNRRRLWKALKVLFSKDQA
ncbi:MAG: exported protein of unknown function [Candidatus Saccharibacteria bacterium]|nr:exported protein of unknown function [Candidatus Saccharibacteria bacterium]